MQTTKVVELKRPAKKLGGDRYETDNGDFLIYIPQNISRPDGTPVDKIKITFET